jgi:hypothetical protein
MKHNAQISAPRRLRAGMLGLAALAAALTIAGPAVADPIPQGWIAKNVEPVGYTDLNGKPASFKMAIKRGDNGRWYLYVGHFSDYGVSVVDVTDPANPRVVNFLEHPKNSGTTQVTISGNLLITGVQHALRPLWPRGNAQLEASERVTIPNTPTPASELPKGGVYLWDISNPERPQQISFWDANGEGTHRNYYPGGRYAYLASTKPGYSGEVLIILDVSDPKNPREVGHWAQDSQRDGAPPSAVRAGFHGVPQFSPDGKLMVLAYAPDLLTFDNSDPVNPKLLGRLTFSPPFEDGATGMHHVLGLWDRNMVLVASEQVREGSCDLAPLQHQSLVDIRDPAKPRLVSTFPIPRPSREEGITSYCNKGGRFGPHNINQEIHSPDVEKPGNLIYTTWFNAGTRIHDISDPHYPTEVGYFIPPKPTKRVGYLPLGALVSSQEDVLVDARGYIYTSDRQYGVHILKYTGPGQPAPAAR